LNSLASEAALRKNGGLLHS